jgi:hypothetical protein
VARVTSFDFGTDEWRKALREAAKMDIGGDGDDLQIGSMYALESTYWQWPILLRDIRALYDGLRTRTGTSEAAPELRRRSEAALAETSKFGEKMIAKARSLGFMEEVIDPASPVGKSYEFLNIRLCELFAGYRLCSQFFTRMNRDLCRLQGLQAEAEAYDQHYRELCVESLMLCNYLIKRGPITCAQYSTSFMFVLEGLEGSHRTYMTNFILDTTGYDFPCERDEAADFFEKYIDAISGYIVPAHIIPLEGSLLRPMQTG